MYRHPKGQGQCDRVRFPGVGLISMPKSHDELLDDAVAAQHRFESVIAKARKARQDAFLAALRGTVTGREIAKATGLSESTVSAIKAGKY